MLISPRNKAVQTRKNSRAHSFVFLWAAACLFFTLAFGGRADKGPVPRRLLKPSPEAQWAILLHNGQEEILILTTEVRVEKPAETLGFLPFPSEPVVQPAPGVPFVEIDKLLREKRVESISMEVTKDKSASTVPPTIALSARTVIRDITVKKVDDISGFRRWVEGWIAEKGASASGTLDSLAKIAGDYLSHEIPYFVFETVALQTEKQSVEPLVYRFKTDKIYYPLKAWNAAGDAGSINLIFIGPGSLSGGRTLVPFDIFTYFYSPYLELAASPRVVFECSNSAPLRPEEIDKVYAQAKEFFAGTKGLHLQVMRYAGPYDFPVDLFFEISKLEPRTFVWGRAPEESPLEGELLLRPVENGPGEIGRPGGRK